MLRSPVEQQLLSSVEDSELKGGSLLATVGPESAQGAWSGHAASADLDSARALATKEAALDIQKHEAVQNHRLSLGISDTHNNILFERGWGEQCNSGQDSQEIIQNLQMQTEGGLQSMQLELQKFKGDVLIQLHALQLANAGKPGTRARSQKGSTRS